MRSLLHILCCCLAVAVAIESDRNPGMKVRFERKAFDYFNSLVTEALEADFKTIQLPDQSLQMNELFEMSISNMRVSFLNGIGSVDLVPNLGLIWKSSGSFMEIEGNYLLKALFIQEEGTFNTKVLNTDLEILITILSDSEGRPLINTGDCKAEIGTIETSAEGGLASQLYSQIKDSIADMLKLQVDQELCEVLTSAANKASMMITEQLPLHIPLSMGYMLDYTMTSAPYFGENHMETCHKGEIVCEDDPSAVSEIMAPSMDELESTCTDNMITIWISDYMFNTLMYQADRKETFKRYVTREDLPEDFRYVLDTTCEQLCIGSIINAIGTEYPYSWVEMSVTGKKVPTVEISESGVEIKFVGSASLYARDLELNTTSFLVRFGVRLTANMNLWMGDQKLYGNITDTNLKLKVSKTAIGELNADLLTFIVNQAVTGLLLAEINKMGEEGFPLPAVVEGVTLENPTLSYIENVIEICTDWKIAVPMMSLEEMMEEVNL